MAMAITRIGSDEVELDWDIGLDVEVVESRTVFIGPAVEVVESESALIELVVEVVVGLGTVYLSGNFGKPLRRIESKWTYTKFCKFIDPPKLELGVGPTRVMVMLCETLLLSPVTAYKT